MHARIPLGVCTSCQFFCMTTGLSLSDCCRSTDFDSSCDSDVIVDQPSLGER